MKNDKPTPEQWKKWFTNHKSSDELMQEAEMVDVLIDDIMDSEHGAHGDHKDL